MSNFTPINKQILSQPLNQEVKTESGLYLPTTSNNDNIISAKVQNVSNDVSQVKNGNLIYFRKDKSIEMMLGGNSYFLIHEDDVLGYSN